MAFCTNCGSAMDANAHFCTKCGKNVSTASAPGAATGAAPAQSYTPAAGTYTPGAAAPSPGGGNVLKVVLIVVGVFVFLGIVSIGGMIYAAHRIKERIKHNVYVTEDGKDSTVETPFGRASTTHSDAKTVAHQMGVDVYPGSTGGESSTAQFGSMTTASIKLTTSDSVDKVAAFYKSRFPNAMMTSKDDGKFTLVGGDKEGTVTITAEPDGDQTRIEIAKVGGLKINVEKH
jgi:hypothetical protein